MATLGLLAWVPCWPGPWRTGTGAGKMLAAARNEGSFEELGVVGPGRSPLLDPFSAGSPILWGGGERAPPEERPKERGAKRAEAGGAPSVGGSEPLSMRLLGLSRELCDHQPVTYPLCAAASAS